MQNLSSLDLRPEQIAKMTVAYLTIADQSSSFVALLGLAGLAVSLAMQGVVENLAGSIIILGTHPFEVGDAVEVDGVTGSVKEIRVMNTKMESFDGKEIYIPNSVRFIASDAFEGCRKIVCKGQEGSYAQKYCEENGIKFVAE